MENSQALPLNDFAALLMPMTSQAVSRGDGNPQRIDFSSILAKATTEPSNVDRAEASSLDLPQQPLSLTLTIPAAQQASSVMMTRSGKPFLQERQAVAVDSRQAMTRDLVGMLPGAAANATQTLGRTADSHDLNDFKGAAIKGTLGSGIGVSGEPALPGSELSTKAAPADLKSGQVPTLDINKAAMEQLQRLDAKTESGQNRAMPEPFSESGEAFRHAVKGNAELRPELIFTQAQKAQYRRDRMEGVSALSTMAAPGIDTNTQTQLHTSPTPFNLSAPAAATSVVPPTALVMNPGEPLVDSFGEKIVWLTQQENQQATLQLKPVELGSVEIRVSIKNASAQIEIHAQRSETGDLIESMLPKLQQSLEQQGLKLDDVRISQSPLFADNQPSRSAQQDQAGQRSNATLREESADADAEDAVETTLEKRGQSSIDAYA